MILDNEEQRKLLLQIITSTNINGNYVQAREAIIMLDKLIEDVKSAKVEE